MRAFLPLIEMTHLMHHCHNVQGLHLFNDFKDVPILDEDDNQVFADEDFDVDIDIVPVTLNYKYEWALGDRLSWYLGVGLGLRFNF